MYQFHKSILRAYDIRGIVGETLSTNDAYYIGALFASKIYEETGSCRICVGFDGRLSSPSLEEELVKGLKSAGADVIRVGIGPTPMLYYAVRLLQADGGIMVTGSHNPANHNGFKFCRAVTPFHGDDITNFQQRLSEGKIRSASGSVTYEDISDAYVEVLANVLSGISSNLVVAWDPGNGAAGAVVKHLLHHLPGKHFAINTEIDGSFPAHHPDPSVASNLEQLIQLVKEQKCDIGLAFDGDGDRLGAVDSNGRILWGDQLLLLLAQDMLNRRPEAKIIADVKCSQIVFDGIKQAGGEAIMYKTGHSLIKDKMIAENAPLAGEMSGHLFFADEYFGYDDGIYAAVRLLRAVINSGVSFTEKVESLPTTYSTPENRINCQEGDAEIIIAKIKEKLSGRNDYDISTIDGVRVTTADGWWLVRASNTQPVLVWRAEGYSKTALERIEAEVNVILNTLSS